MCRAPVEWGLLREGLAVTNFGGRRDPVHTDKIYRVAVVIIRHTSLPAHYAVDTTTEPISYLEATKAAIVAHVLLQGKKWTLSNLHKFQRSNLCIEEYMD